MDKFFFISGLSIFLDVCFGSWKGWLIHNYDREFEEKEYGWVATKLEMF